MKEKFSKYVGNIEYASGLEMKYVYMQLAETDQQTADVLYKQKLYNQAVYFYIQSMEKKIKSCICGSPRNVGAKTAQPRMNKGVEGGWGA